ncbi:MAG: outer membrane protein assembly factor BamB [Gammaproteobacteria bacterium]|nr:outer membrane protein assembly factor BamB [Gammaproteobacteria bacterium]
MKFPTEITSLFLATSLLCGCTAIGDYMLGTDNNEPPVPLQDFDATTEVKTLWSRDIGDGGGRGGSGLTPALADGRIYAAEADGDVVALNAITGESLWRTDTEITISGGPGTGDGLVVVGSEDGEIVALRSQDGLPLWGAQVSSEVLAPPRVADGIVVVRTVDGKLFGFAVGTGQRRWVYDRSVPVLSLRGTAAPALNDGLVIGGFDSGRLIALGIQDGQVVWENRIAVPRGRTELERLVDIDSTPAVIDGLIYAVTFQGRIAALDATTGAVEWRRDMSSHSGIDVDSDFVFVTDEKGHIWSLERDTSASSWRQKKLEFRRATAPRSFADFVVVGDLEGYVHWLRREDGQFAARARVSSAPIVASPLVGKDLLYIYASDGTIAALRPAE